MTNTLAKSEVARGVPRSSGRTGEKSEAKRPRVRMTAEARRELIIEAALQIFSQRPYSEVSMMEIAEASKITRANLNYHFGTKRDLYVEVVRLFARLPPLPPPRRRPLPLSQEVDRIIDRWLDLVWESRGNFLTLHEAGSIHSDEEIGAILEESREAWHARLAELLAVPGGATPVVRGILHAFGAMCESIVDDWLRRERVSREDAHLLLVETLLTITDKVIPVLNQDSAS